MPQAAIIEESVDFSVHDADEEEKTVAPPKKPKKEEPPAPATFVGKASLAGNSMVNMGSVVPAAAAAAKKSSPPQKFQQSTKPANTKATFVTHKKTPSLSPEQKANG